MDFKEGWLRVSNYADLIMYTQPGASAAGKKKALDDMCVRGY